MASNGRDVALNPSVDNHLKYAVYLPAVQTMYSRAVVQNNYSQTLPNGLSVSDLNYFNPESKLFNLQAVLYSAGHIGNHSNPPPCMVSTRQRGPEQNTVVVGDSGGYQIATGQLKMTPSKREEIYDWLVNTCDVSMTLDVPVWALDSGKMQGFNTFADCLYATVDHLDAFTALGAGRHRFLNVLHGRTLEERDIWYDAVKGYDFYGWAMAGRLNTSSASGEPSAFTAILWRILVMLKDGMFDRHQAWIHFLGVGDLKTALLLTTLKNTLNYLLPSCAVQITYDTSSPSQTARCLSGFSSPAISPTGISYTKIDVEKNLWAGSNELLPFEASTIAKYLTKGDVIFESVNGDYIPRELAYLILENNNVEAIVRSIDTAHRLVSSDLSREELNQLIPYHLLDAQDAIEKVLTQNTLEKAREVLMSPATQMHLGNAYKNVKCVVH